MKVYALALLATLVGCGTTEPLPTPHTHTLPTAITDEQVHSYYQEFIQLCNTYDSITCHTNAPKLKSIQIVDKATLDKQAARIRAATPSTVGLCLYSYYTSNPSNIISSDVYILNDNGSGRNWYPEELRALVFHELGHCLLQLYHPNPTRPFTDPAIMNSTMYTLKVYQSHWDAMVSELFTTE